MCRSKLTYDMLDQTWFCFENELVLQNDKMRRT